MTAQRAPDILVAQSPGLAGADGKNKMTDSVNNSPLENPTDNERRQKRLLSEHELLKKFIATHPFIRIKETFGSPPEKYHLVFRVDGLLQAGKSIEPKSEHIVEMLLPDDYPDAPPVCTMLSRIFHPNISADRIDIKEQWAPETTCAGLAIKICQMIVFQRYSIKAPLNKEAAQWAVQNKKTLPLSAVDFYRRTDAASSGSPAKAAAPASAEGDADPLVFEDAAAQLMQDKEEPREDDTAQFSIEVEALSDTEGEKNVARELQPIAASMQQTQIAAPQQTASDEKGSVPVHADSIDVVAQAPRLQKAEMQAPAQAKPRFPGPENRAGELKTRKMAGFDSHAIYCLNCGNKNIWQANFCTRCGVTLTSMAPQRIVRMLIAIGAIVALVLAAEVEIIVFLAGR